MDGEGLRQHRVAGGIDTDDRRRQTRVPTSRKIVVSRFDGSGPIHQGVGVDIGARGMRIRSPLSAPRGSELALELRPIHAGGEVAVLRGVVAFAIETDRNEFDLGVRLDLRLPTATNPSPLSSRRRFNHAVTATAASRNPMTLPMGQAARYVRPKKPSHAPPTRETRTGLMWVGPALVFLLLIFFIPRAADYLTAQDHHASIRTSTLTRNPDDVTSVDREHGSSTQNVASANADGLFALVAKPSHNSPLTSAKSRFAAFRETPHEIGLTPVERFVVPLERALLANEIGDAQSLRQNIDEALALDRVPQAWTDVAHDVLTLDGRAKAGAIENFTLEDSFDIEASSPGIAKVADFHLEVDLSDFVLRVVRNGAILREFPVGLGYDGATPLGEFRIANKITDPAWYNRGDVVPAGDPANPLGRQWMGLGTGGVATSYGIHPTTATDSIGQSDSRGCIRMFPQDAETLFRLCPLGTRVVIYK